MSRNWRLKINSDCAEKIRVDFKYLNVKDPDPNHILPFVSVFNDWERQTREAHRRMTLVQESLRYHLTLVSMFVIGQCFAFNTRYRIKWWQPKSNKDAADHKEYLNDLTLMMSEFWTIVDVHVAMIEYIYAGEKIVGGSLFDSWGDNDDDEDGEDSDFYQLVVNKKSSSEDGNDEEDNNDQTAEGEDSPPTYKICGYSQAFTEERANFLDLCIQRAELNLDMQLRLEDGKKEKFGKLTRADLLRAKLEVIAAFYLFCTLF